MPCLPEAAGKRAANETAHSIELGDERVTYLLRRARRRTIGLSIDQRGLRVGAPPRASLAEIEGVLLRHAAWISKKLVEWQDRRRREPLIIVDGLQLPMLGDRLEIRLALGANRCVWNQTSERTLTLCLRSPADAPRLLEHALREEGRVLFAERLAHYTAQLGVAQPPLALSAARTRWGSCSRQSGIRLNWRLIHFPLPVVDYVVAHEVAHLSEMNHSARFWAIVAQLYPDYRAARAELKARSADCPSWETR